MTARFKRPVFRLAQPVTCALLLAGAASSPASVIPADAIYGDSFPSPGTRGTTLGGDSPEINNSGGGAFYGGNSNARFAVTTTSLSNDINDGSSGVVKLTSKDNIDATLTLVMPSERQFVVQVDLVPFDQVSTSAGRQLGIVFTEQAGEGYFNGTSDNIRVGIGNTNSDELRIQQKRYGSNPSAIASSSLDDFASGSWNQLRLLVDLDTDTIGVYFNDAKVGAYVLPNLSEMGYVGLEGISGTVDGSIYSSGSTAYLDNFQVYVPEPGSFGLISVLFAYALSRRRIA